MTIRFPVNALLVMTYQLRPIGLGVLSGVTENIVTLHPWRHHTELALVHRSPTEWKNVWVIQAFPQQYFFTKSLQAIVSPPGTLRGQYPRRGPPLFYSRHHQKQVSAPSRQPSFRSNPVSTAQYTHMLRRVSLLAS